MHTNSEFHIQKQHLFLLVMICFAILSTSCKILKKDLMLKKSDMSKIEIFFNLCRKTKVTYKEPLGTKEITLLYTWSLNTFTNLL